jgi:serine/threonine protein kinase/tetratricopeptide (TPR) repeat protein
MSGLLERVRAALADEYDVERELGGGGMGVVFLGRDRALDCPVAIKVLRMELATAVAAERFIREAQLLARVQHPAVVTVHRALSKAGLYFMIMELLEGTLADRLCTRQPIPADDVIRFGEQLLEGLAQVHARGIVHRDIKPSNIFIREDGGPKLGDFGIARPMDIGEDGLTATGQIVGTPRYMSPEQLVSSEVTGASDVYSVGMVLYEMVSGRRWELEDPARGRWDGVPHRLARVLRKALTLEPDLRWPDARAFGVALRELRGRRRQLRAVGAGAGVVAILGITTAIVIGLLRPQVAGDRSDIALVFTVDGGESDIGLKLASSTVPHLEVGFGDGGLRVMPPYQSADWTDLVVGDSLPARSWDTLKTNAILRARATVSDDSSVVVTGEVLERHGPVRRLSHVSGMMSGLGDVGCRVALAIARAVRPASEFNCVNMSSSVAATNALIAGDVAFDHDNWPAADSAYRKALRLDSSSARGVWGLYNVCRWARNCDTTPLADLRQAYERYPKQFGDLDQLLIEADVAPTVPQRLGKYDTAITKYGYAAYPKLLLGNELFHRGALAGAGLDSAIAMFNAAVHDNPNMSPAYEMLVWAETRRGREQGARSALAHYQELAWPFSFSAVLKQVVAERFGSDLEIEQGRQGFASRSAQVELVEMLRLGTAFGIPLAQFQWGKRVADMPDPEARTQGLLAQSLALLVLGRIQEAFETFDEAMLANGDISEMRLQADQWAVGFPALGLPGVPTEARQAARGQLAGITDGERGARAWWVLLLDALHNGDVAGGRTAATHVQNADSAGLLSRLSDALLAAARGDTSEALRVTDSLRVWVDSRHHIADPLVRVALFLHRGRWLQERDPTAADAAWRWYENADWAGNWPSGPPKAAEMDWAFETYARYLRAQLAHARGDTARVCAVGMDAAERWRSADSAYKPLRDSLIAWTAGCGPS